MHTPKLLLHSGVGDAGHLAAFNLTALVHSPGVGQNLQDHTFFPIIFNLDAPVRYAKIDPTSPGKLVYVTSERDLRTLLLRSGMLKEPCITQKSALYSPSKEIYFHICCAQVLRYEKPAPQP